MKRRQFIQTAGVGLAMAGVQAAGAFAAPRQSPGENQLEAELNQISQIAKQCREIEDVISQFGMPSETISMPAPSKAVQYRFRSDGEFVSLVVIDNDRRQLKFIAEPIANQ